MAGYALRHHPCLVPIPSTSRTDAKLGHNRYLQPLCRQTNNNVRELLKQDLGCFGRPTPEQQRLAYQASKSTFTKMHIVSRVSPYSGIQVVSSLICFVQQPSGIEITLLPLHPAHGILFNLAHSPLLTMCPPPCSCCFGWVGGLDVGYRL